MWHWLWIGVLLACVLVVALVVALALGWNSPRPTGSPDWSAPRIPRRIDVAAHSSSLLLFDPSPDNFTLEVVARPLSDPRPDYSEYGLVYRVQDAAQYYTLLVGTDGYYAVLRVEGGDVLALVPWQQFPHIGRGQQQNRLLVTCEGISCTFRINDEYATTVEDAKWLSGGVGLLARSYDEEVEVEFESVRLWRIEE